MTDTSRLAVLSRISSGKVYDLGVEYFVGMPSWQEICDQRIQPFLTHTPRGVTVDDPFGIGPDLNKHVSCSGDAMSLYTHTGTHVDALNHFGLNGKIWNRHESDQHPGDRGWHGAGAETILPIVAQGVPIDVAGAHGVDVLQDCYTIDAEELQAVLL